MNGGKNENLIWRGAIVPIHKKMNKIYLAFEHFILVILLNNGAYLHDYGVQH